MGNAHAQGGWTIAEVERLTGLPRRDIQRCCYSGKGGLDIVKPQNSSWGRRCYSVSDVAMLYLVQLEKQSGLSLPEISKQLRDTANAGTRGAAAALAVQAARLDERREAIIGQLTAARALHLALSENETRQVLGAFVESHINDQLVEALRAMTNSGQDESTRFTTETATRERIACPHPLIERGWLSRELSPIASLASRDIARTEPLVAQALARAIDSIHERCDVTHDAARKALIWAFEAPGIALAIELWLGPGAFELIAKTLQ